MSLLRRRMMMLQSDSVRREVEIYEANTLMFYPKAASYRQFRKHGDGFAIGAVSIINGHCLPIVVSTETNQGWSTNVGAGITTLSNTPLRGRYYYTNTTKNGWGNSISEVNYFIFYLNGYTGVSSYSTPLAAATDLLDYYLGVI